jgi:serine protease Do
VVVTQVEPGSPASDAGIQTGDLIQEVNRKPVKNVEDFVQKVEKAKDQDNVLLFNPERTEQPVCCSYPKVS